MEVGGENLDEKITNKEGKLEIKPMILGESSWCHV